MDQAASLRWRIHYLDGSTVSSCAMTWVQAPSTGIVAVVHQCGDSPVRVELGTPYYLQEENYVIRVWDPTLYLRRMGTVKFGRWARTDIFNGAWDEALRCVTTDPKMLTDEGARKGGVVAGTRAAQEGEPRLSWGLWYDDLTVVQGNADDAHAWVRAPSDGVMAAVYRHVSSGIAMSVALRRYTFYFWEHGELINTDDLDRVLAAHPQFKKGCPSFTGGDYLGQARTIKAALEDTLEDVT
jgi:hypothetical protein